MRNFLAVVFLAASISSASAQYEAPQDLTRRVHEFNKKSSEALREYRRTGDYKRYKETIEPLLNEDLQDILEGIRRTVPHTVPES